jgi:hypothetical protein
MNLRQNRWLTGVILAAFLAGIAFAGGVVFASGRLMKPVLAALNSPQTTQSDTASGVAPGVGPSTIADTVANAGPAVVRIDTTIRNLKPERSRHWARAFSSRRTATC